MTIVNNRQLLYFLIGFLFFSCKNSKETKTIAEESSKIEVEQFQTIIDSIYKANPQSIGIIVHIESPKNGISWSGSAGYSNKDTKSKLLPDQPALIASNIKTYVSAAILRLQ